MDVKQPTPPQQNVINKEKGVRLPFIEPLLQPKNLFQKGLLAQAVIFKPVMNFFHYLVFENGLINYLESFAAFLAQRPYLTMPLFTFGVTLFTPVFAFVLFAFLTSAITFTGFLIAEGAILSMGGIILGTFLLSIFGIALALCTMFSVTYFTLQKLRLVK